MRVSKMQHPETNRKGPSIDLGGVQDSKAELAERSQLTIHTRSILLDFCACCFVFTSQHPRVGKLHAPLLNFFVLLVGE